MSACNTFTEHVWKPGECKNCFKPKSQHHLAEGGLKKTGLEVPSQEQNHPPTGTRSNTNSSQRGGGAGSSASARSSHFRPPVAKKPTIAVKPTMMLSCSSAGLDMEGNLQRPPDAGEPGKTSDFAVWTRNGMNRKRPGGPNNNEGEDAGDEIEGYGQGSRRTPTGNDNGLTDVLKEIAGLGSCLNPSPLSGSKDLFLGRISSSFQRSLERGLPASGCLAMGSSSGGATQKRVSVSNSMEVISTEGGRFCYPEFSSEGEDDDEDEEHEEDESDGNDDSEHESWDESDEELLAMEIRMRGQPRFANFRAATLSPVPFAQGKKWNTVPLRNRSLQRICAVDYDDSYDEILNGYPSIDSNGGHGHLPYGPADLQGSGFLSNSECTTSPESSSSLPEDSRTTSSCSSSAHCGPLKNGLHSPSAFRPPVLQAASKVKEQQTQKDLNPPKAIETHKAVLAIRLEDQDGRECLPMPQALPGQPVTISFSPTEEQAKPYRVVNLEKPLICKPYTVVDVSASMASPEEHNQERTPKPKTPVSPLSFPISPLGQPLSPASPMSPSSSISHLSITPSAVQGNACKKLGAIRYQEVWTSSTSPRQKMAKVDLGSSTASGPPVPPRYCSHKSAPTSPIAGLSSSRTVPVKSPNLSEIKFNSYNNAGMPPFPIIIRDDTTYFRSSKNAVKVPIVINPSAYDNLAVYKSFLGLSGELSQPKEGRVASHTYEEIGSSESVQPSPTEQTSVCKVASEKAAVDEKKAAAAALISKELTTRTTIDSVTAVSTASGAVSPATAVQSPLTVAAILSKSSPGSATSAHVRKISGDTTSSREGSADYPPSSCTGTGHRENASTVLSQIVASIQPPQSCPESPYPSSKAYGIDELHALPLDATKEMLNRPKSLFSSTDGCLSKPRKDTPSKQLPKSQSASAAVPLSSPTKSEPNAPFPPPRSTSSPYHASNILQRHFGNWTKPSIASSPTRPSDGETSPGGGEGRRVAESAKPKRWISFKSFFRRRKDDDEQRDKAEKEKGKLVGLDGTVIHMLPPPPIQRHHWFSEAKNEDPNQKPTIIFTYKPDSSASGDGKGELRVEECKETVLLSPEVSRDVRPLSPGRTPSPQMGTAFHCKTISQVPGDANISEGETPTVTSLPGKLARLPPRDEIASLAVTPASVSEGSASLDDPEEDDGHSHSPTSSSCSATYSNLGQSRANMIPLKHPRNMKSSDDALADLEEEATKATPPPLPKKSVARAVFETSSLGKELPIRPKHEAKPGGTNLSVANPVYDLDSTWETGSHSSSISSEARVHDQESGDSLERPVAVVNKGRGANSLSCLMSAPSATTGRERRGCRSAESLAGRARTTGRGGGGNSKQQRQALYKGMDSWEEVVGRIRGLHTDTLRKLAGKCEDRFMAGQKDHLRFGTDSWSHFRLTTGKPCCEAGDAVYYTASYAKDPLVNYAIKICRSKVKETQQQFFHSLAVRQSLALHFNIQQDCGHFLADVPARLLPWEEEEEEKEGNEEKEDEDGQKGKEDKEISTKKDKKEVVETTNVMQNGQAEDSRCPGNPAGASGHLSSRVVVITREVPFQTVADFVRDGASRHARNPDLYERQVCLLLLQLCSGLEHMKPYHVTHCDLRLENLLLVHCQPGNPWNLDLLEPNNNSSNSASSGAGAANAAANATCPARLIISNFSQAKQKNPLVEDPGALRDQSRLAPEIVTATQYRKCDEFQTGILIYEMLHRPNPFEETPELKEREYTWADLPPLPARSLYSQGLQQLASLLLTVNPSERIQMAEARACLQCLLWGPREDLFQALSCTSGPIPGAITSQRETTLQNWLDLKRTLMMIKFAERSLDTGCGVSLEDWLCCQYLAFATTDTLSRVVRILQQQNPRTQHTAQSQNLAQSQNVFKSLHLSQSQQHITHTEHITHSQPL